MWLRLLVRLAVDLLRSGHRIDRLRRGWYGGLPVLRARRGLVSAGPVVPGVGVAGIAITGITVAVVLSGTTTPGLTSVPLVALALVTTVALVTVRMTPVAAGRATGTGVDVRVLVPLVAGLDESAVFAAVELRRAEPGRPRSLRPVRHVLLRSRATALVGMLRG
jgi:hypothetical protein